MKKTFSKSDLKTGMIVEQRDGIKATVLLGTANGDIIAGGTWYPIKQNLKEDLKGVYGHQYDIVKVYQPNSNMSYLNVKHIHTLVWERIEETEDQKHLRELREQYNVLGDKIKAMESK